jgi:hypothetical protein
MSRLLFFTQEAFRALRRNGAPSMAAVVTTVVTVILLGVLIPIFQTTQAKSDQVRDSLEFRVAIYDDATPAEITALERELGEIPHVSSVELITKTEALVELEKDLGKSKSEDLLAQLRDNPLPPTSGSRPTMQPTSTRCAAAVTPPGRTASRSRSRRSSRTSSIARRVPEDRAGDQRAEDRADGDHRALDRRLADACRQHDPALDLHPPPRGRGDAPGRRDPLVHPLAVHDRGRRRRLRRAVW